LSLPAIGQSTLDRPLDAPVPYHVDSGLLSNPSGVPAALHEEIVHIDSAAWLRVYFGATQLGEGSMLRITSLLDGDVQALDADTLAMWGNSSAYFNGDTVRVELIGGPQSEGNRLVIDQLAWEVAVDAPIGSCGICNDDDRVPSDEDFAARLLPAGCSSTVFNTDSCLVTAGHCISGGMVLQFRVPPSSANCNINHPPSSEQFPAGQFSFTNGGVGNDWGVMQVGTNSLGEKPFDRYGVFRPIASAPPSVGDPLRVWGYGIDSQCTRNQVQQTSPGTMSTVSGLFFQHTVDTTFGNSGSSIQRNDEILGIATHCPCPNVATRIDHPSFTSARETLCPTSALQTANLISANVELWGTLVSGGIPELEDSDNQYFVVDSVAGSEFRNTALTVVVAQSPATTVSELNLKLEFGAATAAPVFVIIQIFNWDTDAYELLNLSVASTGGDSVFSFDDLSNPNSYVDGTGRVQLRLVETARTSQTPSGFTKRIDQVQVTVRG
jgi:V8-like Glu-specific endopeptidase